MMGKLLRMLGVNVDEASRKLERRFAQGGVSSPDAPINYLFFQRIASLFLFAVALMVILSPAEGVDQIADWIGGLFIMIIAIFGPVPLSAEPHRPPHEEAAARLPRHARPAADLRRVRPRA
ncbi:MAG: hypothetical protein WDN72_10230 [Alphaproteobacteria bacterium]